MLDLEVWFFVLLGLFIVLYVALHHILFKPMLKVFKEREEAIDGSLMAAKDMEQEKEEKLASLKRDITEGSRMAKEKFDAIRAEGSESQRQAMEASGKEASGMIDKARAELKKESEKASATLRADVDKFSDEIVSKLLKV